MEAESYKGYAIWGHAIFQDGAYAGSGTVTLQNRLIESSGILDSFDTEDNARLVGLEWARAWVDSHG
ncbi:hypothetical protein [Paraburkholderia sp.]|uniref:hypothetical protein n=1 Tax=Paraburkholderia sp. TaxID=1926495 RepID=UPI00238DB85E|nr:hypothetical protein [Paraburkholderia sp.]MDE1180749.1 hypothetical protein [Paraburkholderia sp.]